MVWQAQRALDGHVRLAGRSALRRRSRPVRFAPNEAASPHTAKVGATPHNEAGNHPNRPTADAPTSNNMLTHNRIVSTQGPRTALEASKTAPVATHTYNATPTVRPHDGAN